MKLISVAGLVLGVLALLFSWLPIIGAWALPLAVIGIVLGAVSVAKSKTSENARWEVLPVAGLVVSIAALVSIVGFVFLWANFATKINDAGSLQPAGSSAIFGDGHGNWLAFRTLNWSCQPAGDEDQGLDSSSPTSVCLLDFEVKVRNFEIDGNDPADSLSRSPLTVNSLDQRVLDRCYQPLQGLTLKKLIAMNYTGGYSRGGPCSLRYRYSGIISREAGYEAWDLSYKPETGTCIDQMVDPAVALVCQAQFRISGSATFVDYTWPIFRNTDDGGSLLPGEEAPLTADDFALVAEEP